MRSEQVFPGPYAIVLRLSEKTLAENVNSEPGCYLRLNSGRDVMSGARWLAFKRVSSSQPLSE